jgi:trimeric autotransporter adhesin
MKKVKLFIIALLIGTSLSGQIKGKVFRDYNGNGTFDSTSTYVEWGAGNISIKAYNSIDVLIASTVSDSLGGYVFSSGAISSGTDVRLEFTFPTTATNSLSKLIDFTTPMGSSATNSLSSVVFATAGAATTINYGINNPEDFNINQNPNVFVSMYRNGNNTASATFPTIAAYDSSTFVSFPYDAFGQRNGNIYTKTLARTRSIGSCYGIAYSKQTGYLFTSAVLKRHTGLGPADGSTVYTRQPGSIYLLKPSSGTSDSAAFFTTLDSTLFGSAYYTHDRFNTTSVNHINSNTNRGLLNNVYGKANDRLVFNQVGSTGLGGLEIDQNGRYLYTINLYTKELVKIDLRDSVNPLKPTSPSHISRYAIPALSPSDAAKGVQRPWAVKFYREKVYIGAILDASTTNLKADLKAFVYEFDPLTSTFNTVLSTSLNYTRSSPVGNTSGTLPCANMAGWYPWTTTFRMDSCRGWSGTLNTHIRPQPIFTDIEFDREDAMIMTFSDRAGYQGGVGQRSPTSNLGTLYDTYVNGEILRAYRKKSDCVFQIETNAKEGSHSAKTATSGLGNSEGLGGGEFYVGDGKTDSATLGFSWHPDNSSGSLAFLPGANHIMLTFVDPINAGTNGFAKLNNRTGDTLKGKSFEAYNLANVGTHSKGHGLGDIEIVKPVAPIEVGNRVWHDLDYDGIQEAGEPPISGVELTLFSDPNGDGNPADGATIGTATTDANGIWIFSSYSGTSTSSRRYGLTILPNTNYIVRVTNATIDTFGNVSTDFITGDSYSTIKTLSNAVGNGETDWSDNDGIIFWQSPNPYAHIQTTFRTGKAGENNHTIDFGFSRMLFILNNTEIKLSGNLLDNKNAILNWECANKEIVEMFEIQRSLDGNNFEKIKTVNASIYQTLDNLEMISNEVFYYRIKIYEKQQRVFYSNIIKLIKKDFRNIKVLSNPIVNNQINLEIKVSKKEKLSFLLFDSQGRLVQTANRDVIEGYQNIILKQPIIRQGTYTLKVSSNSYQNVIKLVFL